MRHILRFGTGVAVIAFLLFMPMAGLLEAQDVSTPDSEDAASPVYLVIRPHDKTDGARFEATIEPGETAEFTAVLENLGENPINVRTFVSDIVPTANGGLTTSPYDAERTGLTLWVDYPTEEIMLQPGESVERRLAVTIPPDTLPGEYVNAVSIETVDPVTEGAVFRQFFRKVTTIYITVPGEVNADFAIGEPQIITDSGSSALLIPITNSGNVRLDLNSSFALTDKNGEQFAAGEMRLGPIYMGQETIFYVEFSSVPEPGEYSLSYSFVDDQSQREVTGEAVAVEAPEDQNPIVDTSLMFENIVIEPNADPIVFANVSLVVNSRTTTFSSTKLTLSIYRDGELVEDFVLSENLSLIAGEPASVSQRYLPATNWEPGTYTFSLKLESIDGGQSSILLQEEDVATLEVP